jgi:hypothetical protein
MAVAPVACPAANIDRFTLTEVINSVRIIEPATKKSTAAQVRQDLVAPNVLRTGADSRAEMMAPDQVTTARVGQNSIFSFARDSREIELQQGSILFQSPTGKGGGTIRTPAASAAVLGTTLIVTTTKNGGFKVLLVEGHGRVRGANGAVRNLTSGQMVYALPGGKLSGVFEFRLSQQVGASNLIRGFKGKLASSGKIQAAINKQEKEIAGGSAIDTGLLASGSPSIAYKVDVAVDTIVEQQGANPLNTAPTRFQSASSTDAAVTTATLDAARVFVPEDVDQPEFPGDSRPILLGVSEDGFVQRASNAAQFISANILFDTPTLSLDSFSGRDAVRFLALNNIQFNQSLDLGVFNAPIQFWAGGTFQVPGNTPILISASAPQMTLAAFGDSFSTTQPLPDSFSAISTKVPLRLMSFSAQNKGGSLGIIGGHVELLGTRLGAKTDLHVAATEDLTITGAAAGPAPPSIAVNPVGLPPRAAVLVAGDLVDLAAAHDLNLAAVAVGAPRIEVKSKNDMRLQTVLLNDGSSEPSGSPLAPPSPSGPHISLSTGNLMKLTQVNFLSNRVALQAQTISLTDVAFRQGSLVILESQRGKLASNPNTGQPASPGFVNFIKGVRYGDSPAQNSVVGGGGPGTNSGIIIRPRK